jgi:hypothetical protein
MYEPISVSQGYPVAMVNANRSVLIRPDTGNVSISFSTSPTIVYQGTVNEYLFAPAFEFTIQDILNTDNAEQIANLAMNDQVQVIIEYQIIPVHSGVMKMELVNGIWLRTLHNFF